MQFSLRAMMVAVLLCALYLVTPYVVSSLVARTIWLVLPALLVVVVWPSIDERVVFARGSLATYCALMLSREDYDWPLRSLLGLPNEFLNIVFVLLAGAAGVYATRRGQAAGRPATADTSLRSGRDSAPG
jgi:hypothetical protein